MNRRTFLQSSLVASVLASTQRAVASTPTATPSPPPAPAAKARARGVVTPNGSSLPWKIRDGVKVGHLVAESFMHEFTPGLRAECWGYNGSTPGPTIEAVEGDRVRLYVTNRLPEPTTVHWHGLFVPNGMDGVAGITQRAIPPGATWKYELVLTRAGTFMYHPHFDEMTQMALGMVGMIVVHPRSERARIDRDFVLMAHEWKIRPGARRPDPLAMNDFNVLTFNGKAYPATAPLLVGRGERVRLRFGNLGAMDHHPIHLHGHAFRVTATDGGDVPSSAQRLETTVLVPVGTTRVVEFVADALGDWPMHCHMTHHIMNQMGHEMPIMIGADAQKIDDKVGSEVSGFMAMGHDGMGAMGEMTMPVPPNSVPMRGGAGPFGRIDMGGMFTILKVRDDPDHADPNGWYVHPRGTVAEAASAADLAADGIVVSG